MNNKQTEYQDYYASEYPIYMEEYWLKNGYEKINGRLVPKEDPLSLNSQGIPTNDFGLPAVPGRNMMGIDTKTQLENNYLDQYSIYGMDLIPNSPGGGENVVYKKINFERSLSEEKQEILRNYTKFGGKNYSEEEIEYLKGGYKSRIVGYLNWKVKNGNLVIPKDGTYAFRFLAEWSLPDGTDLDELPYKKTLLKLIGINGDKYIAYEQMGRHIVFCPDCLAGTTIFYAPQGTNIYFELGNTLNSPSICAISLDIIKLS